MRLMNIIGAAVGLALASSAFAATTDSFILPYNATVTLSLDGGFAAAISTFGVGTSQSDAMPLFANLPKTQSTPAVNLGYFPAGTPLNVYIETVWGGKTYWAFSDEPTAPASITAFTDTDNSLKMDGSIYQEVTPTQYVMHLDDAASYTFDDDDADLLIKITLTPVPEPASALSLTLGASLLLMKRRRIAT